MTRREYQRRWIACKRARLSGFNIDLANDFLSVAKAKGYSTITAREALCLAAGEGVFGTLQRGKL